MTNDIVTRNNIHTFGSGTQPIMFAHGFGCAQPIWRLVAPAFADSHQVVLFDYVGAGRSDRSAFSATRYATLAGYAQDVVDICTALDLREIVFVGHSVSGMIGLLASLRMPERFANLILIGSSPRYINDPPDYYGGFEREDIEGLLDLMEKNYRGWASYLAPLVMKNADRPELARELEESFHATEPTIARHFAEATFFTDNRQDLPHVAVRSLLLQCRDDMIVPQQVAEYLRDHIPASTLCELHATGHYPHVSHAAEVIRQLNQFLR
ncbi:MAG TPA: alpha/beta hydrolase [Kouleothrix sp.]|uniref:alpha/beta fold hydrolase n=1 Tax=Kouleothrix sp. TaxID=2779161 RepID=UPI002B564E10|nr:alpha/beta hydrolase [Kouleothrix sp.]HRC74885.1 alpha/beta hydrolase [Kouleothrix sp.]